MEQIIAQFFQPMAEQVEINKPHLFNLTLEQRLIANAVIDTVNVLNAVCFTVDATRRCNKMYLMRSSISLQLTHQLSSSV